MPLMAKTSACAATTPPRLVSRVRPAAATSYCAADNPTCAATVPVPLPARLLPPRCPPYFTRPPVAEEYVPRPHLHRSHPCRFHLQHSRSGDGPRGSGHGGAELSEHSSPKGAATCHREEHPRGQARKGNVPPPPSLWLCWLPAARYSGGEDME